MRELLQSLDRPIAFQRSFVRMTGSITAALMLSQAIYWSLRSQGGDGWFWKTMRGWEDETGLSRSEQEGARKLLRDQGVLCEEKRGMPAKVWFRVDEEKLQARLQESCKQGCRKPANKVAEKRQPSIGTESTSETTAEITNNPLPPSQATGKLCVDAAADRVMQAGGFSNRRLKPVILRALQQHVASFDVGADETAALMISNWAQYCRDGPLLRFTWSPRKFFDDGHWRNWELWPIDRARLDRMQNASVGAR